MQDFKSAKAFAWYLFTIAATGAVSALIAALQPMLAAQGAPACLAADPGTAGALGAAVAAIAKARIVA